MLLYFKNNDIDYAIIEAGIGGEDDSTNIFEKNILSIITSISIDHVEKLGDNLIDISINKSGIIKQNCDVVLYSQTKEVYNNIYKISKSKESKLYYLEDLLEMKIIKMDLDGTIFSIKHRCFEYSNVFIKLLGKHQVYNVATALLAIEVLKNKGLTISKDLTLNALGNTTWPCRLELLSFKNKKFLLDGAHNFDAILKLMEFIKTYLRNVNPIIVFGMMADKEYEKSLDILLKSEKQIILTMPKSKRAMDPSFLDNKATNIIIKNDYKEAINYLFEENCKFDIIVVIGSLYLVSDTKKYLKEKYS